MKILEITILTDLPGTDHISCKTDLPDAIPFGNDCLYLKFEAQKGAGIEFCRKHFNGIPIKTINCKTGIESRI